jgi:hypothetical protein
MSKDPAAALTVEHIEPTEITLESSIKVENNCPNEVVNNSLSYIWSLDFIMITFQTLKKLLRKYFTTY